MGDLHVSCRERLLASLCVDRTLLGRFCLLGGKRIWMVMSWPS